MEGIGTLSPVDVRAVWADEARDFTPWLAENAALLGEARWEWTCYTRRPRRRSGRYSADLVFREESTETASWSSRTCSDPPTTTIWASCSSTRPGWRPATRSCSLPSSGTSTELPLDWLNSISAEDFGFFGIVLEAWRIGDSLSAPRLRVEVKPNNWSDSVQAAHSSGLTETQQAYLRFWGEFLPAFRDVYPGWTRATVPQKRHWMTFPSARSGLARYSAAFCRPDGRRLLRAEAYIKTGERESTKEAFDALREKREQIEQAVCEELEWDDHVDRGRASRISLYFPDEIRVTDEERWPEARDWLIQAMGKMRAAFDPALQELRD